MELLCAVPANLRKKQQVYALHGPDATTELAMISTLRSLKALKLPLLPALLQPNSGTDEHAAASAAPDEAASCSEACDLQSAVVSAVHTIVQQFGLNTEQAAVLRAMQPWFLPGSKVCSAV